MDNLQRHGIGMTSQRTRNRMIERLQEQGIKNTSVLEVMANVPRHLFVDEALSHRAYEDSALPIGYGQTISQPYTVARMTEILLQDGPMNKVLEVGTGCGYQAAVLSALVTRVYSVERIEPLQQKTQLRLQQLGYRNIKSTLADGYWGWPEYATYNGILVAAANPQVPEALLQQLAEGGRLIMPLGGSEQRLITIVRKQDQFIREELEGVFFVPFLAGIQH